MGPAHSQLIPSLPQLRRLAILSFTTFCSCSFSSSPSNRPRNESDIFSTTPLHPCSNLARSSACCTSASRVPTLNSGIEKGYVVP